MTIAINATPGDAAANSYVTLLEANTYLEAHLQASNWSALDDEKKKASLVSATREIDTMQFNGRRASQAQSLVWPRLGLYDYDSYQITGIPTRLKSAVFELAIWNLTEEDRLAGKFEIDTMESVEIGPIKYKIGAGASSFPDSVEDLLEAIGPSVLLEDSNAYVMVL